MERYSEVVQQMLNPFAGWLSEKDPLRYAAVEALTLGHGGIDYIARLTARSTTRSSTGCSRR